MADDKADTSARPTATTMASSIRTSGRSSGTPPATNLRNRLSHQISRQSLAESPRPPGADSRRSSLMSFSSLDDVTQRLTDDIINPSMRRTTLEREAEQVTHWHSTPLVFALLPALGGLMFKNGSAYVTDMILLVLAAIFMNWSIRLPWDWYYSAQEQLREAESSDYFSQSQHLNGGDTAVESASSAEASPNGRAQDDRQAPSMEHLLNDDDTRGAAASELRRQEIWALLSTFFLPVLAAYLLHAIRSQLSTSSTHLVSDYNLSIFLLAAEVRPCRQLMRLLSKRTMHLQRTVSGLDDPFGSAVEEKNILSNLTSRIAELESRLAENTIVPPSVSIAQKTDVSDLSAEMKKRYEPRLEGLERAVRRYEKRSTTLAMLIEQRLGQLETRLQDALSLAAVAAQHSHRGPMARLADNIAATLMWPVQVVWRIVAGPFHVIDDFYSKIQTLLFGPRPPPANKRGSPRNAGKHSKPREENGTVTRKAAK